MAARAGHDTVKAKQRFTFHKHAADKLRRPIGGIFRKGQDTKDIDNSDVLGRELGKSLKLGGSKHDLQRDENSCVRHEYQRHLFTQRAEKEPTYRRFASRSRNRSHRAWTDGAVPLEPAGCSRHRDA